MAKQTLKEQIYHKILNSVMNREIDIDTFIKEGELAEKYQVSKAPVREALIQLCNENIIRNIPRAGYQIIQLTQKDIYEATQVRKILEIEAMKIALSIITSENLKEISLLNEKTHYSKEQKVTLREWWSGNQQFHMLICSFANNKLLLQMLERTFNILWRAIIQIFSDDEPELYKRHDENNHYLIEEQIRNKDIDKLTEILIKDIYSIPKRYLL